MMAMPIKMLAVALIPPVYIIFPPLWWWCLYVFLVLGKLSLDKVIRLCSIGRRPALSSNHLRCCWRAAHISCKAAVAFFCWSVLWCLQFSLMIDWGSDLLYFVSRIRVAHLVVSCVLFSSMAKLSFSFSALSSIAPCRWLMFLIGKMISSITVIVLALKSRTIPNYFMVSVPKIRLYCGLLPFSYLTTSGSE